MVTISHIVRKCLEGKPFVIEGLGKGIISHGNLADELKPEIEKELKKKVHDAAIVMALRRYAEELENKGFRQKRFNFSTELMIKTNICDFNVQKTPLLLSRVASLYKIADYEKGDFLNVIIGNNEVSIAASQKICNRVIHFLKGEKILTRESDLVAITTVFTGDFIHTPGIVFQAVRKLAWENINIFEIISTLSELTFIVKNSDSMKAYEVLQELIEKTGDSR